MSTKEKKPICKLCSETELEAIGVMNNVMIRFCPKCDRVNKGKR